MMVTFKRLVCFALVGIPFVFGCDQGDGGNADTSGASQLSAESLAQLAAADAVDGTTDKVVSKCLTCNLGMDGDAAHTATAGDYKLHLCSDHCKAGFEKDPAGALAAVKIPKSE